MEEEGRDCDLCLWVGGGESMERVESHPWRKKVINHLLRVPCLQNATN